ncbi:MAG: group 1 truncated hemoglobin [Betaproteobacteria bacterium]
MNHRLLLAALCAAFLLAGAAPAARAQSAAPAPAASADNALYLALGGQAGIARIVDDFVPRLVADPRTGEFFKKTNQAHLKEMLALQFCTVSGGGCVYTGIPMKTAHQDMDISKGDFNALVEVLQKSMSAQGVAFSTQNQLLARLAPMHRDIINVH